MDNYGVSPCDLAADEEMMRALGMFKSIVMLENTAAFVIKVRLFVRFLLTPPKGLLWAFYCRFLSTPLRLCALHLEAVCRLCCSCTVGRCIIMMVFS